MLKRLISAVFVLGLVLALNGTAISDVTKGELNPVIKVNPNHERFLEAIDVRPDQPTFKKPESALKELPGGMSAPTPPQTYFCDVQDYTSGNPFYYWPIPDAYGDDLFNMRFTSDAGYYCTTMVGHYLMYGDVMTGTPDMRCYLWDDDGFGFPDNKLDSVDIPYASLPTSGLGYVSADFTHGGTTWWEFSDGEEYHLGWTILQSGPADTLALISDQADGPYAGEERASEYVGGIWGTMLNDWGIDISFFILSERCCGEIPYSSCNWQTYWQNITYLWQAPHPVYGDEAYAMRMSISGAETLKVVDFMVYDAGGGTFGNDDVYMTVYDDDGAGLPGAQIAQVTFPAGTYPAFPSWTTATFDLVLIPGYNITGNSFHVAFSSSAVFGSGEFECCLSSDGTDGVGRSSSDWGGGTWVSMLDGWGKDYNLLFDAYLCKDEYYECAWNWCYAGATYFWYLPDAYGDWAHASRFVGEGKECRIQDVVWYLYNNGTPTAYTTQSEIQVWTDIGGLPGTKLAGITIGPGSGIPYVFFPGPMAVDFEPLNVTVSGAYWVAIESFGTDSTDGIRTLSDDGGGTCVNSWAEFWGGWSTMCTYWGVGCDWNVLAEAFHCCVPYTGRDCDARAGEDWFTYQHDYARTGASFNAVSDAWCDMTVNWAYEDPTSGVTFCGPIIAGEGVVCSFSDHYIKFDLATGAPIYTIPFGPPVVGGSIRSTPTVAPVAGLGGIDVLFASGGDQYSVMAYDYATGTLIWSRDIGTVGPTGLFGMTRWGRFTVLDEVVYWGTDDGKVVAAMAATGQLYTGWGDTTVAGNNPIDLTLSTWVSGATDGENLFFATQGSGVEGDIYSINAATGLPFNWVLSSSDPLGLRGNDIWTHTNGYFGDEGFTAGVSYENGTLYANSRAEADHPTDGLFYSIDAGTGTVNYATLANRAYYSTPIIDVNHCYMPALTRWMGPPAGGNLYAVKKSNGVIERVISGPNGGRYYVDGILTCEPEPEPDYIYAFDEDGFLQMINSTDFDEIYRRRIFYYPGYAPNIGMAGAIAPDPTGAMHVVFATYWGGLIDMTKQDDRPRLEIQKYEMKTPVEFGTAPSLIVTVEDVYTNTGCANLNILNVIVDEDDCGINIPSFVSQVDPVFMDNAAKIADKLTSHSYMKVATRLNSNTLEEDNILSVREMDLSKERLNRAAAGFPTYLNPPGVIQPQAGDVIIPNDTMDLVMDVIQANILRGPQCFYIQVETDDPDFFLNNPTLPPCQHVCLIGGCLTDSTTLHFGVGGANYQYVFNHGRFVAVDDDGVPWGFDIDGDTEAFWMATYLHAISQRRIAFNIEYFNGDWISWQADPNWCDNECKPYLDVTVALGEYTTDGGQNYTTIGGEMVCASGVDSVQNFDDGSGWDWNWADAPFDSDSSMGLYVNSRTIGALDIPALANLTLEIFEFTERNNQDILNWKFMAWIDTDAGVIAGAGDTMMINRDVSAVWTTAPSCTGPAWGLIKIPFGGCGYTPLKNVVTLDSDNSFYHDDPGNYLDSAYIYASRAPGEYSMPNPMTKRDQSMHATLVEKDTIYASETFDFGIAVFGFAGLTNTCPGNGPVPEVEDLAVLVNKWAGFGRGDVNNDGNINLCDIIYLAATVNVPGAPGAAPFKHLSDVNADNNIDMLDVNYLIDYYFNCGPCPLGDWIF